jgi:hypothetical protein
LDLAGWQPVTRAMANNPAVWLERFGDKPPELYFTVYNPGDTEQTVSLAFDNSAVSRDSILRELVTCGQSSSVKLVIPAKSLRVLQVVRWIAQSSPNAR